MRNILFLLLLVNSGFSQSYRDLENYTPYIYKSIDLHDFNTIVEDTFLMWVGEVTFLNSNWELDTKPDTAYSITVVEPGDYVQINKLKSSVAREEKIKEAKKNHAVLVKNILPDVKPMKNRWDTMKEEEKLKWCREVNRQVMEKIKLKGSKYENKAARQYLSLYGGLAIYIQNETLYGSKFKIFTKEKNILPAGIILSQGIIESGYGTCYGTRKHNIHFFVKAHKWKGPVYLVEDDEYKKINGKWVKIKSKFRSYPNAKAAFEDHARFLEQSRYRKARKSGINLDTWARELKKAKYATGANYDKKLIKVIQDYNLDVYNKLLYNLYWIEDQKSYSTKITSK